MGDRHRQDFSIIAFPSTLDSGIPSNLWGLTVQLSLTLKVNLMYEKIRRHSSLASDGVGVIKSQKRNMLRSSENSVLIPLMIK